MERLRAQAAGEAGLVHGRGDEAAGEGLAVGDEGPLSVSGDEERQAQATDAGWPVAGAGAVAEGLGAGSCPDPGSTPRRLLRATCWRTATRAPGHGKRLLATVKYSALSASCRARVRSPSRGVRRPGRRARPRRGAVQQVRVQGGDPVIRDSTLW